MADKEMTFWEHIGELRMRLIRSALFLIIAATAGWFTYPWVYKMMFVPAEPVFKLHHISVIWMTFTGPFFMQFQLALIIGLCYALPLISLEAWGFVAPALLPHEKRWLYFVAPLSILFFLLGVVTGYLVMTPAVRWFISYIPPEQQLLQNAADFLLFECKCVVAFGLVFQLPVVLMFLAMVGILSSQMLKKQWRYAVCVLTIVAAVVTPSNDPATMLAMAIPLVVLYGLSIFLVQITEKMCGRTKAPVHSNGKGPNNPLQTG